jgi:uncharacterized protein YjcR
MPKKQPAEGPKPVAAPKVPAQQTKRQTVEHWIKSGQPCTQIAGELGLSYPTLKEWKRRYYGDATPVRCELARAARHTKKR